MPSKPTLAIIGAISVIALFSLFKFPFSSLNHTEPLFPPSSKDGIVHIVMFEFKEEATAEQVTDVCDRMLALKQKCLHPTTKKPYVKMGMGGKQNSPEGLTGGMTHIFVEEFENEQDREYYLNKDPVHLAFVKSIGDVVKTAQVVDFTPGVF
ncbi:uncharacterized protein LY89DRAFT_686591 [Mollisia scopiformis]|uniref:Stress-response A/B barrel domain-containing protein n=1 Tax=Mollisia scopiformis TaxID=149040 RepID=A0A194X4B0_MOLSC|nr:uncharacterized protein LY89DRAFT_686591 [Mollisia scopiformis]KUJ15011.1 hypothetical protein LY89DRAFT_686591 [Mollisia scopiformis]